MIVHIIKLLSKSVCISASFYSNSNKYSKAFIIIILDKDDRNYSTTYAFRFQNIHAELNSFYN